jgi:hypothetical protein
MGLSTRQGDDDGEQLATTLLTIPQNALASRLQRRVRHLFAGGPGVA